MRTLLYGPLIVLALSAAQAPLHAQEATPAKPPVKKPPSKLTQLVKKVADTAVTTAAGMAVDTLLGQKGRALAGQLTGTASGACPAGTVAVAMGAAGAGLDPSAVGALAGGSGHSAGAAVVGAAKQALKSKAANAAASAAGVTAPTAAGVVCQPVGVGAAGAGVMGGANAVMAAQAAQAAAAAQAAQGGMPGMGALAAATPVGMAVAAAPLAGQAVKGLKGMFGKKPMDKITMLRELGKGHLELKSAKFIEGTAELEPGFEAEFAALGEALPMSEGTYILHVAAEQPEKGGAADTALARKRIEKAWTALLVNGVPDQKVIAVGVLPAEMQQGRKPPKRGDARVELIRLPAQP